MSYADRVPRRIPGATPDFTSIVSPNWPEIPIPRRVETPLAQFSPQTLAELEEVKKRLERAEKEGLANTLKWYDSNRLTVEDVDRLGEHYSEGRIDRPNQSNFHD